MDHKAEAERLVEIVRQMVMRYDIDIEEEWPGLTEILAAHRSRVVVAYACFDCGYFSGRCAGSSEIQVIVCQSEHDDDNTRGRMGDPCRAAVRPLVGGK